MSEKIDLKDSDLSDLMKEFPEAKITIRDRIPTNLLLLYTFLNINKTIKDIKYSTDEIRESILALVAMLPDGLRDDQFLKELNEARKEIMMDVRPIFCTTKASLEYCNRKGIPAFIKVPQLNYFMMYHAVFNLLMRKHMLLKAQTKEIMGGIPEITEDDKLWENSES